MCCLAKEHAENMETPWFWVKDILLSEEFADKLVTAELITAA